MIILIPAYEPDGRLLDLVGDLQSGLRHHDMDGEIVLVDDGSGPQYAGLFISLAVAGARVLSYGENRGKGSAVKYGLDWVRRNRPGQAVVCVDADGQHRPSDVLRVAAAVAPGRIVLGARHFAGSVPVRSRIGNSACRAVFAAATGVRMVDTQTGLRGYPSGLVRWLGTVPGERFEWETSVLLAAVDEELALVEVGIDTVYDPRFHASHFRPVRDSALVMARLLDWWVRRVLPRRRRRDPWLSPGPRQVQPVPVRTDRR